MPEWGMLHSSVAVAHANISVALSTLPSGFVMSLVLNVMQVVMVGRNVIEWKSIIRAKYATGRVKSRDVLTSKVFVSRGDLQGWNVPGFYSSCCIFCSYNWLPFICWRNNEPLQHQESNYCNHHCFVLGHAVHIVHVYSKSLHIYIYSLRRSEEFWVELFRRLVFSGGTRGLRSVLMPIVLPGCNQRNVHTSKYCLGLPSRSVCTSFHSLS